MKIKIVLNILIFCCITLSHAQIKNNSYDFIVVPAKFDFLKKPDAYRVNTLTRYLFKQEGHTVYYDTENLPANPCNGIFADVKEIKGSLFKSKLQIVIKNCTGTTIFESEIGESRLKAYKDAYQEAIRMAFSSVQFAEIINSSSLRPDSDDTVSTKSIIENIDLKRSETNTDMVNVSKQTAIKTEETRPRLISENPEKLTEVLYAQKTDDGYQLVDKSPKIVMVLVSTAMDDVFLVKNQNAMVFKKNEKWYYTNSKGVEKVEYELEIKF